MDYFVALCPKTKAMTISVSFCVNLAVFFCVGGLGSAHIVQMLICGGELWPWTFPVTLTGNCYKSWHVLIIMLFHTANGREKSINFVHFLVISSLRVTCDFWTQTCFVTSVCVPSRLRPEWVRALKSYLIFLWN